MSTELLAATNLRKSAGGSLLLDDVSITIQRGEIVGLLGLNGAGKSTALNIITGVHQPDSGSVTIAGVSATREPVTCRAKLGYLPDTAPLYDDMRVERYLQHTARLRGANRRLARTQTDAILADLELNSHRQHTIGHLSKGYRQRVGLAQALIHDPDLLVLDEPSNGLDPLQARALHDVIQSRAGHRGVLFSSHQLQDVAEVCTHVVVLNRGKSVFQGSLDTALHKTGRLQITFRRDVSDAQLRPLPTVASAQAISPTVWLITPAARSDTHAATNAELLQDLLRAELPVDTVMPEKSSLEQIFSTLTGQLAESDSTAQHMAADQTLAMDLTRGEAL